MIRLKKILDKLVDEVKLVHLIIVDIITNPICGLEVIITSEKIETPKVNKVVSLKKASFMLSLVDT